MRTDNLVMASMIRSPMVNSPMELCSYLTRLGFIGYPSIYDALRFEKEDGRLFLKVAETKRLIAYELISGYLKQIRFPNQRAGRVYKYYNNNCYGLHKNFCLERDGVFYFNGKINDPKQFHEYSSHFLAPEKSVKETFRILVRELNDIIISNDTAIITDLDEIVKNEWITVD